MQVPRHTLEFVHYLGRTGVDGQLQDVAARVAEITAPADGGLGGTDRFDAISVHARPGGQQPAMLSASMARSSVKVAGCGHAPWAALVGSAKNASMVPPRARRHTGMYRPNLLLDSTSSAAIASTNVMFRYLSCHPKICLAPALILAMAMAMAMVQWQSTR